MMKTLEFLADAADWHAPSSADSSVWGLYPKTKLDKLEKFKTELENRGGCLYFKENENSKFVEFSFYDPSI